MSPTKRQERIPTAEAREHRPSAPQRVQIAARAILAPKTVDRVYDGRGSEYSFERVSAAAQELNLPQPKRARRGAQ
jgi:hypothetical protein